MKTTMNHHRCWNMDSDETWWLLKERALESTAEGVVISDCAQPDMPIIYVNNAFTAMTGYSYDEVVGKNCRFLQGSETDSAAAKEIRKAISEQRPCKVEILNYRKDGTRFWNNLSITPVRDDDGRITHFIGIQTDITRRREAEESLRDANTQLTRDLRAAAAVQQALLPKTLPETERFQFSWRYQPCQELAGDTLNVMQLDDEHVAVYVLDVCGHGVRAALQSFSLAQDLRPRQGGPVLDSPGHVFDRLNKKYPLDPETGMFFTILYGVLNTRTGEFTYSSAGHPGPILIQKGHTPHILQTHSYPIGVSAEACYSTETIRLEPGDKLLLYTDGVVEALSAVDKPFGEERLLRTIRRAQDKPVGVILDAIMKSLENWACHVDLRDDISLVGIEMLS